MSQHKPYRRLRILPTKSCCDCLRGGFGPFIEDKQKILLSLEEWKKEKGPADNRALPSNSERSGAVSGNSSAKGLLQESNEHLSRYALTSQEDIAKVAHSEHATKQNAFASLAKGQKKQPPK